VHGWTWLTGLSIVHGPVHVALLVTAVAGLAGLLLLWRDRRWWSRRVPLAALVSLLLLGAGRLWLEVAKPWPDPLPGTVWAWCGAGVLALALLVLGWRRRSRPVRTAAVVAALLVVVGAADGVDTVYGAFPTIATALQLPPPDTVPAATVLQPAQASTEPVPGRPLSETWRPDGSVPAKGAVTQVTIPPTRSGFAARNAWLYLPPAYFAADRPLLPVLVMLGGQPGGPRDWLDGGRLAEVMDGWAAAHQGLAPVVVMPDATGAGAANPMCLDSALGRADTYLSQDVVDWASSTLQVDPDHAHWAVGGFSYGGTCALQLAVAHPDEFPSFFDASGQREPTLGSRSRTVAAAFRGDDAALTAVDPLTELAARRYDGSAGYLVVGAQDAVYEPQQRAVAAAASAAGLPVIATELPGGHSWSVCGAGLEQAMPWLSTRMGLTP
jgi:S-formylglutathione hydrolase FrmB